MITLVNFLHTPGQVYALGYWVGIMFFAFLNVQQKKSSRFVGLSFLFLIVLLFIMTLTDGIQGPLFLLCELLNFSILLLFYTLITQDPLRKGFYFSVRGFVVGEFVSALEWQLYCYCFEKWSLLSHMSAAILFLLFVYFCVFFVFYMLERPYRSFNTILEFPNKELQVVGFLCIFGFVLSNLSFVIPDSPFSSTYTQDIFIIRTLANFGVTGLLFAHHVQLCEVNNRVEREFLEKMLYMQEENYRMSAESMNLINQKYHDLKHYIYLLRSDLQKDAKMQYLEELEDEIKTFEAQNHTGNKILDTLLAAKRIQCQKFGISITCVADGAALNFMKGSDLSVLFGNLLDNAIEGVQELDDPDKRLIHISVQQKKQFLNISMENCCRESLSFHEGLPLTTKKDSRFHGYGVKSIQSIAKKYGGSMVITCKDGWFKVHLLLPLP